MPHSLSEAGGRGPGYDQRESRMSLLRASSDSLRRAASFRAGTRGRTGAGPASPQASSHTPAHAPAVPLGPGGGRRLRMRLEPCARRARRRRRRRHRLARRGVTGEPERSRHRGSPRRRGRVSGVRTLRTTGRVAPNENAVYPLVARRGRRGEVRGDDRVLREEERVLSRSSPGVVNARSSTSPGSTRSTG